MNKALEIFNKVKNDDEVVHISEAAVNKGEYTIPYSLGYKIFDDALLGGVRGGDLILITGISKHGKTVVATNFCINLSKNAKSTLFFSYEVSINNLYAKIKQMGFNSDNLLLFTPKRNTSGNLGWIAEKIEEGIKKYGTRFVFIDNLDFVSPTTIKNQDQKRFEDYRSAMEFKTLAIELNIIIFIISHVKKIPYDRAVEMQDTYESGIYKLVDIMFCVQRGSKDVKIGGVKKKIFDDISTLSILANRLTGEMPIMSFVLNNNIIIPVDTNIQEVYKNKGEIEIVNNEKEDDDNKIGNVNINTLF